MHDATKLRLLNAAGEIFAEKGFPAASVREICQRAEANIAAVHYHFGDKQALYVQAVRTAQCAQSDEIPFPEIAAETPPEVQLRLFLGTMFQRMMDKNRPKWHLQLILRELADPTETCETIVQDYVRPLANRLRGIVSQLVPSETDDELCWRICFSIIGQVLFHYIHRPIVERLIGSDMYSRMTVDVLSDHVARFSLAAIGCGLPLLEREPQPCPATP